MTLEVVGYESGATPDHPLIWGAAAVRDDRGIFNAVLSYTHGCPMSNEDWEKTIRKGSATAIEVPIPIEEVGPYYVADVRLDLFDRAPYAVQNDPVHLMMHHMVAMGRGQTRGYFILKSHDKLQSWIYHMNAVKFMLVPA